MLAKRNLALSRSLAPNDLLTFFRVFLYSLYAFYFLLSLITLSPSFQTISLKTLFPRT